MRSILYNQIPSEIWINIFKYINVKSLSKLICTNHFFYNLINSQFWYIIDTINDNLTDRLIPATIETYNKYIYLIDWNAIIMYNQSNNKKIPESVIKWIPNTKDLQVITIYQTFSENLVQQIFHKINYHTLLSTQTVPQNILHYIIETNMLNNQDWHYIWSKQPINCNFIDTYIDNIQWHPLSSNKNSVTHRIINKYGENLVWHEFTKHSINENILKLFIHKFDLICWNNIARYTILSEDFIKTFIDFLDIGSIIRYQKLSQDFINNLISKFTDFEFDLHFQTICTYQKLSKDFLLRYKNHYNYRTLIKNKQIPRSFIYELFNK